MKTITMDWETYQEELSRARVSGARPIADLIKLLREIDDTAWAEHEGGAWPPAYLYKVQAAIKDYEENL